MDIQHFDAFDCSRRGLEFSGELPLASLARLVADLPAQHGTVRWRVRGDTGPLGEPLLRLQVAAEPLVVCQRCLEPFAWPVDTEAALHLVRTEEELDADAPVTEDDEAEFDKVLGTGRFPLVEHIEDELILSLPYIPRHPECPPGALASPEAEPEPERPQPFAALGELKGRLKKD